MAAPTSSLPQAEIQPPLELGQQHDHEQRHEEDPRDGEAFGRFIRDRHCSAPSGRRQARRRAHRV
jgi:hypothetical protein